MKDLGHGLGVACIILALAFVTPPCTGKNCEGESPLAALVRTATTGADR